ncbi:hypothetical protein X760_05960 [Mesorhizobium sp. LSHC422A00]|nr:hypothetical protein X760_05960 [Mesorhizobium sp. LSHC422A00]
MADYDISINLSYGEGNIHGLITDSSLSEQLEDSTIPISPSQDDYIQMYKSIYDPVFDQEAGSSIQHQYVPYEIKIENGGDQENQTVVLNAYQHNGKYYLEFAYAAPVWGMSAGDERWDIGIIDFTCTSPPILLSLCKRIISRVKIGAESALGD